MQLEGLTCTVAVGRWQEVEPGSTMSSILAAAAAAAAKAGTMEGIAKCKNEKWEIGRNF